MPDVPKNPRSCRIVFAFDESRLVTREQLEARGLVDGQPQARECFPTTTQRSDPMGRMPTHRLPCGHFIQHADGQGTCRLCTSTPAPRADDPWALGALAFAAMQATVRGYTPALFVQLPLNVQNGWIAAAAAIRQRVLEEAGIATAKETPHVPL